ncbi:MAG: sulfur carrier protein ThiS [Acetobacteraceae bacterium]|nr:sulfur carrier protein ThiS [Acetobacteraceae bacterium]
MQQATQEALELTVNGERRSFAAKLTVAAMLAELGLDIRKVAVERNEEIVRRATYADIVLKSGDVLEIVHFIGGG